MEYTRKAPRTAGTTIHRTQGSSDARRSVLLPLFDAMDVQVLKRRYSGLPLYRAVGFEDACATSCAKDYGAGAEARTLE